MDAIVASSEISGMIACVELKVLLMNEIFERIRLRESRG